jgi:hypothetical protein
MITTARRKYVYAQPVTVGYLSIFSCFSSYPNTNPNLNLTLTLKLTQTRTLNQTLTLNLTLTLAVT